MRLTEKDKRVLVAFTHRHEADGPKLHTNGERLDGYGMGLNNIAEWAAGHVVFHDLGSRSGQTIQRALKKLLPPGTFGGYNRGAGEKWIAKALGVKRRRLGLGPHHRKSVRLSAAHPGELHHALHVPMGEKIPMATLERAAHAPGHLGKRARLARTLRGFKR